MIIYPPLDKLMEHVDSRYTLVIATAKRARQLTGTGEGCVDKPVITAVKEIYEGVVRFKNSETAVENGDKIKNISYDLDEG